ncbi:MAG: DUF2807 domain-containing protein [Salinivirgaceae bacterium]|jgi:hypothetical protein|nr:DUF2807 domain-containing protein [Salinivirgaceae bacterium]
MPTKISSFTAWLILSVPAFLLLINSCDAFYDEGEWATEVRNTEDFYRVNVKDVVDVIYKYSDSTYAEINFYRKHLSDIKLSVTDEILTIESAFSSQWYTDIRKPVITIYSPGFSHLFVKTAAGFYCVDTLKHSRFLFQVVGDLYDARLLVDVPLLEISIESASGVTEVHGEVAVLSILNRGESKIDASQIVVPKAIVRQESYLDVWINATDFLNYEIRRGGDIHLYGTPEIQGTIYGTGKLIRYGADK